MEESIVIRETRPDDKPFILNSWLKSYKDESLFAAEIRNDIYYKWHNEIIQRILERGTTKILVAASKEDSDVIAGYLVTEKIRGYDIAHYVYVKRAFNGLGICKLLFQISPLKYTSHMTRAGRPVAEKAGIIYVPYFLFI